MGMNILVTGGAGYIGSHTLVELIHKGHTPVVVDNLINSNREAVRRVEKITKRSIDFHEIDLRDREKLSEVFDAYQFYAVIHFAGLKAVGESVEKPLKYYQNNLDSTLTLCEVMHEHNVNTLVFSSSATVYGADAEVPYRESAPIGINLTSPYGRTKYMIEEILADISQADPNLEVTILRYFNPIGAHESGEIGEDPSGTPNNLLPYVAQVAVGKLPRLSVFGGDYDTPDGTCVRDYIHVSDLARGHVAALEHSGAGIHIYNLGSGHGVSVLEIIKAFETASGKPIPYEIVDRRPGDLPSFYADSSKANKTLGWHTEKSLNDACLDIWKWQSQNQNGFKT